MIPDNDIIMFFRFSEQRWIDAIIQGKLSFSCAGAYVHQAKTTDNEIQGDRYEGIFARLENDDKRITLMKDKLGNDLITIPDGDYTLLRRKSAMLKPIFCLYGYKAIDALRDAGEELHAGMNTIRHEFDPNMFAGFSGDWKSTVIADDRRFTVLILEPKPFVDRIKLSLLSNGISYKMGIVDYEKRGNKTFFIEPTSSYDELFCKDPMYAYQYEARICLKQIRFLSIFERFPLEIGKLPEGAYKIDHQPLVMFTKANVDDRSKLSPAELEELTHG